MDFSHTHAFCSQYFLEEAHQWESGPCVHGPGCSCGSVVYMRLTGVGSVTVSLDGPLFQIRIDSESPWMREDDMCAVHKALEDCLSCSELTVLLDHGCLPRGDLVGVTRDALKLCQFLRALEDATCTVCGGCGNHHQECSQARRILAATRIQRAWRWWRRRNAAAAKIQGAALPWLYQPGVGAMYRRLQARFESMSRPFLPTA